MMERGAREPVIHQYLSLDSIEPNRTWGKNLENIPFVNNLNKLINYKIDSGKSEHIFSIFSVFYTQTTHNSRIICENRYSLQHINSFYSHFIRSVAWSSLQIIIFS